MENTKICSKCGRELPLECFGKHKRMKDGLQAWCKSCNKQYNKQWYADNTEAIKQQHKQWHAEHRDERIEKMKLYYATIEGYARSIRKANLKKDRKQGRIAADEDPLPSLEYYIWALQQPDFYDGKHYPFTEMGLDRIYNDKPHTFANVVPCSTKNNVRKGRKSFEEFCELMKKKRMGLNPFFFF